MEPGSYIAWNRSGLASVHWIRRACGRQTHVGAFLLTLFECEKYKRMFWAFWCYPDFVSWLNERFFSFCLYWNL